MRAFFPNDFNVVEPYTLNLGSQVLAPMSGRVKPLARGEAREWKARCLLTMRVLEKRIASNAPSGAISSLFYIPEGGPDLGPQPSYRPGQVVALSAYYERFLAERLYGPEACILRPALLVAISDEIDLCPEPGTLTPSSLVRESIMLFPLEGADDPDLTRGSVVFGARPDIVFRGRRLIVETDRPFDVDVFDLTIGHTMQVAGSGAISAAILTKNDSPITPMCTMTPAQLLRVRLVNRGETPVEVKVTVEGVGLR